MNQSAPYHQQRTAIGIAVVVCASDPITRLGTVGILEQRFTVLDEANRANADIVVIADSAIDEATSSWLRAVNSEAKAAGRPAPRSMLVTDDADKVSAAAVVEHGIAAVLASSPLTPAQLVKAVISVNGGGAYLPPKLQWELLTELNRLRQDVLEPQGLTACGMAAREREVLRLIADGCSTGEIAIQLSYSERTVKSVLHAVMARNNLNTRPHAVAYAVRTGAV